MQVPLNHLRDFLMARFGAAHLDAVAVLGPNALAFLLENREAIAPGASRKGGVT